MINYFFEKPERSSRDEYLRKLAENAVDQILTHKDPNAQAWQTVRRNLGLPNEYLEFKPKEPEQYNLPEFKPSAQTYHLRRENPFKPRPMPRFSNWEEYSKWLLKDLPKPHNLPQNSNPFKLLETGNDTVHQNDYPEIKSSLPEQFNAPEFKPWRPNNFQELGIMAGYARDNLNDKTVKGLTALYYLVDALQKKATGNWNPKPGDYNRGVFFRNDTEGITYGDYRREKLLGGNPTDWYANWSDFDPIYEWEPKSVLGAHVQGYVTSALDHFSPTEILKMATLGKYFNLSKVVGIKGAQELWDAATNSKDAYDELRNYMQNNSENNE